MSDPSSQGPRVVIVRTGQKFPPLKYDPDATPDTSVVSAARRNGQLVSTRRILRPTLVRFTLIYSQMISISRFAGRTSPPARGACRPERPPARPADLRFRWTCS